MLRIAAVLAAALASSSALAGANCTRHPKNEWMSEADAKAKIQSQGYKIRKFKIDGDCYEIYGTDKDGRKVEIYFDTKTLAVVKSETRK